MAPPPDLTAGRTVEAVCIPRSRSGHAPFAMEFVADLRDLDPRPVRKGTTVVGERIIHELRGLA